MRGFIWVILSLTIFVSTGAAAQATRKLTVDCWDDIYVNNTCALCGGAGKYNSNTYYPGPYPNAPWRPTCAYADPFATTDKIISVKAELFMKNCTTTGNPLTFNATINGQSIASPITLTTGDCSCDGLCLVATFTDATPSGFPGYVPGGNNVFGIDVAVGVIALDHVDLTLTIPSTETAAVTALDPYIPTGTAVVNKCVLYRSLLTGTLTNGGVPIVGRIATFQSDRNTPTVVDVFKQPTQPTDSSGNVSGQVDTRKTGKATVTVKDMNTTKPAEITFDQATYETAFDITTYYTPLESDFSGAQVTNPCGLTGAFNKRFLRTVTVEGSGVAADGTFVQYDNGCYRTDTCARTSTGACAQAGVTAAVDPTIVPMGTSFNITGVGGRTAQDIGAKILSYHIDDYVGIGKSNYSSKTLKRAVRLLKGDPSCAN